MLTSEENDLICRVEGDAPMGQIMRRQWIPALLSEEIREPDCSPVPIRLLGEDLVAWRDSDGRVGLTDLQCAHRRASLALGRNEDNGLRCLYHGWKFNVEGDVIDTPSEPGGCPQAGLKLKAYPTHEHGGFVWAYMGPRATMPVFTPPPFAPDAKSKVSITKIKVNCNWAQVLEGAIDSSHSSSLHSSDIMPARVGGTEANSRHFLRPSTDKAPRIEVQTTDYGFSYAAIRRPITGADKNDYVRITIFIAPYTVMIPPTMSFGLANVNVPIDDTHTMFHFIAWSETESGAPDQEEWRKFCGAQVGIDVDEAFTNKRSINNRYLQDRDAMKTGHFTGIRGIPQQDIAMWETMGAIADRDHDRLGAGDRAIVEFRRLMLEQAQQVRDAGLPVSQPAAVDDHAVTLTDLRSFEGLLPKGGEWRALASVDGQQARADELVDQAPGPVGGTVSA